jgi:hypothetical protein
MRLKFLFKWNKNTPCLQQGKVIINLFVNIDLNNKKIKLGCRFQYYLPYDEQ